MTREEIFELIDQTIFPNSERAISPEDVNSLLKTIYDNAPQPAPYFEHYIGEAYGGGVIFHLWKDDDGVERGLIVDTENIAIGNAWSNVTGTMIGSTAQSTWNGMGNSLAIVAQSGHTNSAAKLCLDSTRGGFDDWYLPAFDELRIIYDARFHINQTLSTLNPSGVIPLFNGSMWCSTDINLTGWIPIFSGIGTPDTADKSTYISGHSIATRAIRQF